MKKTRHLTREFHTAEDFEGRTFLDALGDAFTPPEDLPLHQPDYGAMARVRDGMRIREYWEKAVASVTRAANLPR